MRTNIKLKTMSLTNLESILHDVVIMHDTLSSIERITLVPDDIVMKILSAKEEHIDGQAFLIIPWVSKPTGPLVDTQYASYESDEDVELILRCDKFGNKTVIMIVTPNDSDDYDDAIVNIFYSGSEIHLFEELAEMGVTKDNCETINGDRPFLTDGIDDVNVFEELIKNAKSFAFKSVSDDTVITVDKTDASSIRLQAINQAFALSKEKYNTRSTRYGDMVMYNTIFKEGTGEVTVTTFPGSDIGISCINKTPAGDIVMGHVTFDMLQASKYEGATPLYVIGLGAIGAIDALQVVREIDNALGINPLYPPANDLNQGDITAWREHTANAVAPLKDTIYFEHQHGSVIKFKTGGSDYIIRINWSLNIVSFENGKFIQAHVYLGEPDLIKCLQIALGMKNSLHRMIKANTGKSIPAPAKSKVTRMINKLITNSKKTPVH